MQCLADSGVGTSFAADFTPSTPGISYVVTTIDVSLQADGGATNAFVLLALGAFNFFSEEQLTGSFYGQTQWSWRGELLVAGNAILTITGEAAAGGTWGCQVTGWRFPL